MEAFIDGNRVVYDTFDGYNFGPEEGFDLQAFDRALDEVDFYFKRSFEASHHILLRNAAKLRPLGLNYRVTSASNRWHSGTRPLDLRRLGRSVADALAALLGRSDRRTLRVEAFEHPPEHTSCPRILFMSRLWDPGEVAQASVASQRRSINAFRVACVRALRREFGDRVFGGIVDTPYARRMAPDCIIPRRECIQQAFLRRVHSSTVCIATTGLHGSIGWKMAEYVAASRAIVSEPLVYDVPGDFESGRNYLEFTSVDELAAAVNRLTADAELRRGMMDANAAYYRAHVRPDALVMNTIRIVTTSQFGRSAFAGVERVAPSGLTGHAALRGGVPAPGSSSGPLALDRLSPPRP